MEVTLIQPTFTRLSVEISPLSKRKPSAPYLTERFDLFICGHEFAMRFPS